MPGLLQRRKEALHDDVVGYDGQGRSRRRGRDAAQCCGEAATESVEVREAHDVDDRGIAEQQARHRTLALDDEHDRHGVLAGELDFDSDTE